MELLLKLSTDESISLAEAKELTEHSKAENRTPADFAVGLIKEGLRRRREQRPTEPAAPAAQTLDRTR